MKSQKFKNRERFSKKLVRLFQIAVETLHTEAGEMGSLTAAGAGRRSSSRRGSRSSEYQQQQQQQQLNQTPNHNNRDNNCQISASGGSGGGVSPYVSVAVRVLESGSSRIFGFRDACSWCRDIWHWIEAAVERRCPPRWTPWILAGGSIMAGSFLAILWVIMDVVWIYSQLCSLTVPFFALMSGYLLLALGFRHSWTPTGIYLTFCGSIIGETLGFFLSSALDAQNGWDARGAAAAAASAVHFNEAGHHQQESRHQTEDEGAAAAAVGIQLAGMTLPRRETAQFLLHPLYLLAYTLTLAATSRLTDTLSSSQSTFIVVSVVLLRSAGCVTLPSLPIVLRPAVTYLAGLLGILVAKFTETSLIQPDVVPMSSMIINSSSSLPNPQLPLQTGSNGGSGGGSLSGSRRTSAVDHESRVMAARRRRTSSAALTSTQASAASSVATGQSGASSQGGGCNTTGNNKVRRTSLPALLANKKDHLLVSIRRFDGVPLPREPDLTVDIQFLHYLLTHFGPMNDAQSAALWGLDVALLSEAHGLVTDLLLESSTMPPQLASGLKALANLLSPPLPHQSSGGPIMDRRPRHTLPHVALSDVQYASDTEEIPYTGESLFQHLSKGGRKFLAEMRDFNGGGKSERKGKRFVPPNLLRRMSTSTWTTTTSATGMPTIEPEPCRKRTASFRSGLEIRLRLSTLPPIQTKLNFQANCSARLSPPVKLWATLAHGTSATTSSSSPNQSQLSLPGLVAFSANEPMNPNSINNINNNNSASTPSGSNKSRSHSTTSLYNQHPNGKRLMRERKTVCSLHPLSSTTPTPNEYSSSTGLLFPDNASNCPGLVPNDSEALQQQQQQHLRDRDDSENEAFSYSLPGSAVDSRRGSGLSTRRSSGAGSGAGGGGSVGGGGGSRRGSAQQPIAVIEDQRSTGAGSDCEAPESGSSNVLRITEYVTSRTLASSRTGSVNRQISSYEDDENDGDGEAGDDELESGDAADSGETTTRQQQIRPGRRSGHLSGSGSGHGSIKPRTSDYESSDSPNSSDHCEEMPSSRTCTALEEAESQQQQQQPPVVIRTEIEDPDCPHAIPSSGIEADDEDYIDHRESFTALEENENCRLISLEDGSRFDLDQLESDQLLSDLKEWDYPIFDLLDRYTDTILSATALRMSSQVVTSFDRQLYSGFTRAIKVVNRITFGEIRRGGYRGYG
ncbi:hypothetical protein DAPPUDRAFT_250482 [Daphnia pulex]|uniref:Uncharacterized protein n=1 Tax=Daphnia pulex TaxID=6669 RepID=E9GYN4_DAPPU|nr:hypothetical protein DAPPUDRAFT_250482 [Daphnia pulex]|eukprot:EFX75429.1 hypothetical protein DAPPUDRAFT_250482 [Daphnia pulex]